MKQYVERRSQWIDRALLGDVHSPSTPAIVTPNKIDTSAPTLKLQLSPGISAQRVRWRLAEITDTRSNAAKAGWIGKYEIDPLWYAGRTTAGTRQDLEKVTVTTFGLACRMGKGAGYWSSPIQFTVAQ
jgi:hypothetical protein